MRSGLWVFPLLGVMGMGVGCADDPGDGTGPEDDQLPAGVVESIPANTAWGEHTLVRARTWVDAQVPYCGGPNGGKDVICGGTCVRSGDSKNTEWDPYRSDCSGFLSWAWGLEAPGRAS